MSALRRSKSASECRLPSERSERGADFLDDGDEAKLLAALCADCPQAAAAYVSNLAIDQPDAVASCTFYRAGTLVLTRPKTTQQLPRFVGATEGRDPQRVVVARRSATNCTGSEQYDLVHVVDQPSIRLLFVHRAQASDELVRAAAVCVVNEDVEKNAKHSLEVVEAARAKEDPSDEDKAPHVRDNGRPLRISRRESETHNPPVGNRHSHHDDDCAADDLEGGKQSATSLLNEPPVDELATTPVARRCAIL